MSLAPGMRLGPYEILGTLGAGGMGEVYRARHVKLRREVAIKILPGAVADDRVGLARFEREARTASALNHPNIVTIHDIAEQDATTYIAMELVSGRTVRELVADGPLSIDRTLRIAIQIADGLATAHAAGIVHRDIKPANVMVTDDGLIKILDFGLAKPLSTRPEFEASRSSLTLTGEGVVCGTPHYMAPEQWSGEATDHRSDQFALGVLLYEMLVGEPPFHGPTPGAIASAVLARRTPSVREVRRAVPADLDRLIRRCLDKDPGDRFQGTAELADALKACWERRRRATHGFVATVRRPAVAVPLGAILLGTAAATALWVRGADRRWAEREAVTEISSLIAAGKVFEAYRTGLRAKEYRDGDPELEAVFDRITLPVAINTSPAGAEVSVKAYATPEAPWERLGVTPLSLRIPYAAMRIRITREGYEPFEGAPFSPSAIAALAAGLVLDPVGSRPPGMVRIPAGRSNVRGTIHDGKPIGPIPAFYLDRFEVTNRQFQAFVDAGGYAEPEWWPAPIERDGAEVDWREAVDGFRDTTGRPGPAGWELGRHPTGRESHPVTGISWYEAAAYCAFAGKALPTIHHWNHAIGQEQLSDILLHSNIGGEGDGVTPVGQFQGLAAYGTYDMAGNVKEWMWNGTGDQRYLLGGSWNEPRYLFRHLVAYDPWSRDPTSGVRCARFTDPPSDAMLEPVRPVRAYAEAEPMGEREFELVRGMYAYERDDLEARLERVNDSLSYYRRETVSFRTAYGAERMEVHLLIPRDATPPYQSVIWFPGDDVFALRSSETMSSAYLVDFIPRSGRVLVQPVYYGMYERFGRRPESPIERRDALVRWAQDLGRTIDYLESRDDFDASRIAFYGFSGGATFGPVFTTVEPRIRTAILLGGGFVPRPYRPEVHPANFGPRSRTPTLMINGRDDFIIPYETAQRPFFEMLGAPEEHKRHAVLAGGHIPSDPLAIIREVLDWLDRQLGPVGRRRP